MKRGHLQLAFLVGIMFAIMVPATILSSSSLSGRVLNVPDPEKSTSITEHDSVEPIAQVPDESPTPESQTENPPSNHVTSTRDEPIHTDEGKEQDPSATGPQIVPDNEDDVDGDGSEPATNRSVVGWSSGSISQLQATSATGPARLSIPSLSINATVVGVGVDRNGAMVIPDTADTVGWYQHGPAPGQPGSSVIGGHLDDAYGRSVFYDLSRIEAGAVVSIVMEDGTETVFEVVEKQTYGALALPTDTLFARNGEPTLALITCHGVFDRSAGRYTENMVVYATPVS
jgi:sortase (surface protein transpeptidase)